MDRLTERRESPQMGRKPSYYIPINRVKENLIQTIGRDTEMKGTVATRLGAYEDIGGVEEIKKKLGIW